MSNKVKALVLLSGGLDSMLSARTLIEQGIEVVGITFISSFFGATRGLEAARKLNIPLIAFNIAEKHLEMVKKPKYGYGKNMNPCIDCHSMMLAEAKEILNGKEVVLVYPDGSFKAVAQKYDFIATGEVLGQRPMSQNPRALKTVANYSGTGDLLVRPLSAKLMDETLPEKEGKVDREKLLDINGRSRSRQTELAKHYDLKDYPSPAGGCLLTVPEYSQKLRTLIGNWPDAKNIDCELIKYGRVFWLNLKDEPVLVVVARDERESMMLEKLVKFGGKLAMVKDIMGPAVIIKSRSSIELPAAVVDVDVPRELNMNNVKTVLDTVGDLYDVASLFVGYYTNKARGQKVQVEIK